MSDAQMEDLLISARGFMRNEIDDTVKMSWEKQPDGWWVVTCEDEEDCTYLNKIRPVMLVEKGQLVRIGDTMRELPQLVEMEISRYGDLDVVVVEAADHIVARLLYTAAMYA